MAIQKAYDRMIDAPTICANSDAATVTAVNAINTTSICAAWIKLYGQFNGEGTGMSNNKFVTKFTDLIRSTFKNIPNIDSSAIFKEHKSPTSSSTIDETANQLTFEILSTICEDTAYTLISPYFEADDEDANDRDGRRAFFALLREFFPRTTHSAGEAERKLRNFKFTNDKSKNVKQRAEFRKLIEDYGDARGHPLTKQEKYNATTDSIDTPEFSKLTTILDFQKEHDDQDMDWLLNKIKTFVERNDKNKSEQNNKGVAFGVTTTSPTTTNVEELLTKLNANIAAITSAAQTAPRGPNKAKKTSTSATRTRKFDPNGPPPYPCKYCPGEELHWGRDCPRLAELERTKETKHKLAAVTNQTLSPNRGFALGMQAASKRPYGNVNLGGGALATLFKIDTAASKPITNDKDLYKDFDETKAMDFDVVHGESVRSLGSGIVDLIAMDTDGEWTTITVNDVHYIPGQSMNLISVSSALTQNGVSNPDFVNLTWDINGKTFKMIQTNGTFAFDAIPATK